ncbi:MAG: YbaB/EbfC family nucleoid-associated protein [Bacilli bacterium]|jgi:DNA-binding YbaB/EbfC family protein
MNNNMKSLMAQAQKMQRLLKQKMEELAEKEFEVVKGGGIKLVMTGDRTVVEIEIEEDLLEKENKEMVETMLILAFNECLEKIKAAEEQINNEVAGGLPGGF